MSPALAGRFLTTVSPGKSPNDATIKERIQRPTLFKTYSSLTTLRAGYSSKDTFAMFMNNGTKKVLNILQNEQMS